MSSMRNTREGEKVTAHATVSNGTPVSMAGHVAHLGEIHLPFPNELTSARKPLQGPSAAEATGSK